MQDHPSAYIPMDRRQAMARRESLPDRATGAALFADISGFTPLTEALVQELGAQRAAEELTLILNQVYDSLISVLHYWGGSATAFAGDAITCWFDQDDAARAVSCALAMQKAMGQFQRVQTPKGALIALSVKTSVAAGSVRRFVVGDHKIRYIDALAGRTLERLAAADHLANRGEVVLDPVALSQLAGRIHVLEERVDDAGERFAVIERLLFDAQSAQWPTIALDALSDDDVRCWLLPSVYNQLERGFSRFMADLRPAVALFVRFGGIDYDDDEQAGPKLDTFIRWIQHVVERHEGTLIDLNIGDKRSYIYINFGAPIAHEDNAARAVAAALELRHLTPDVEFAGPLQIGIPQGRMRAGPFGGSERRTYNVIGDDVNLAARLMMAAAPGEILVSPSVRSETQRYFVHEQLAPISLKGRREAVAASRTVGSRQRATILAQSYGSEIVGRTDELTILAARAEEALLGRGQVVLIQGEAGIGKSRLISAVAELLEERSVAIHAGECESSGVGASYLVWQPIWRSLLSIAGETPDDRLAALTRRVSELNPRLLRRVPLLALLLNMQIADNDLTASFDARLRKSSLEGLLIEFLRAICQNEPQCLILEDCHWIDPLSQDLLDTIAQSIVNLPVLLVVTHRPVQEGRPNLERVSDLAFQSLIELGPLADDDLVGIVRQRLSRLDSLSSGARSMDTLARRIATRAEGNPFYAEELVNYLLDRADTLDSIGSIDQIELPNSLYSLVLARVDRLTDRQRTLLKVSSVVGRTFRFEWPIAVSMELQPRAQALGDMVALSRMQVTRPEPGEPEMTYAFTHITFHDVIYESLPFATRTSLHENIGKYIEEHYAGELEQFVYALAFHYGRSPNLERKHHYLRWAGEAAEAAYANTAAIEYYQEVLPLAGGPERVELLRRLGAVLQLVGQWNEAERCYREAMELAMAQGDHLEEARNLMAVGELKRLSGSYPEALDDFITAHSTFESLGDMAGVAQVLHYCGTLAAYQGHYEKAIDHFSESLALRRDLGDRSGEARLLNNMAIIAEYRGDYDGALDLMRQSLEIWRSLSDRWGTAMVLGNIGNVLLAQERLLEARERLGESIALLREIGARWNSANTLNNAANVERALGQFSRAADLYVESLTITRELGDRWAIAYLLEDIGMLALRTGEPKRALTLAGAAGSLRLSIGAPLPPADQQRVAEFMATAREAVGEQADEIIYNGSALSLGDAIETAIVFLHRLTP